MATKLPSGKYRTQILVGKADGKRIYKSFVAKTARAADLAALEYQAKNPSYLAREKFSACAWEFLRARKDVLSPSTYRVYSGYISFLEEKYADFCGTTLDDMDKPLIQRVINSIAANHAPKTVRNYSAFIGEVFLYYDMEYPKIALPKKKKPVLNIPDEEVLKRLFEAVKGTDMEVPVLLAALVPMRRGEIVAARIEDLSDDNILHIHRSIAIGQDWEMIEKAPKTEGSDRYVKLPDYVADLIREKGYICKYTIKSLSPTFAKYLKKAGIEHFRFHDLRHAFVSIAHAAGIPDAYIMARGGWATSYTVNNVYRHVLDADRVKMEDAVNTKMLSLF